MKDSQTDKLDKLTQSIAAINFISALGMLPESQLVAANVLLAPRGSLILTIGSKNLMWVIETREDYYKCARELAEQLHLTGEAKEVLAL